LPNLKISLSSILPATKITTADNNVSYLTYLNTQPPCLDTDKIQLSPGIKTDDYLPTIFLENVCSCCFIA